MTHETDASRSDQLEPGDEICWAWTVPGGRTYRQVRTVVDVEADHVVFDLSDDGQRIHRRLVDEWLLSDDRHFHVLDESGCEQFEGSDRPSGEKF